jgi:hypothetical protein
MSNGQAGFIFDSNSEDNFALGFKHGSEGHACESTIDEYVDGYLKGLDVARLKKRSSRITADDVLGEAV